MDKVTQVNVEGHSYGFVAGQAVKGSCASAASDWVKTIILPEGAELAEGMVVATLFLNTNSVGFSDPVTIYSATENVYYYDPEMTQPVTLPPFEDCYVIEHISGTQYSYIAYPVANINGERIPVCDSRGRPCGGPIWSGGDTIASLYLDNKLLMLHSTTINQVLLGSTLPVTSGAVASECSDLYNALEPVDEVTSGVMKAPTSNAVANGCFKKDKKILLKGKTYGTNTYTDDNPKLIFNNEDSSQNISLTFTDYDSVQSPASLTLNGNQGGEAFIAPIIKAVTNLVTPKINGYPAIVITDASFSVTESYVKFSNGLLIQWGRRTNSTSNGYSLRYPKAFSSATSYYINASPNSYVDHVMNCYNRAAQTCTVNRASSASTDWTWFAIGY